MGWVSSCYLPSIPNRIGQKQLVTSSNCSSTSTINSSSSDSFNQTNLVADYNDVSGSTNELSKQVQADNAGGGFNLQAFEMRLGIPGGNAYFERQEDGSYRREFEGINAADTSVWWIQGNTLYCEGGTLSIDNGNGTITTQNVTRGVYFINAQGQIERRDGDIQSWTIPLARLRATVGSNGSAYYVNPDGLAHYLVVDQNRRRRGLIWRADGQLYINGQWALCPNPPPGTMFVGGPNAQGQWVMPGANPNEPPYHLASNGNTIIRYRGTGNNFTVQQYNRDNNTWSNISLSSISDINLYRQIIHSLLPNATHGDNNTTHVTLSNGQTITLSYSNVNGQSTITITEGNPQSIFNNLNQAEHQMFQMLSSQCNLQIRVGNNNHTLQVLTVNNNEGRPELRYQYQGNGQTTICSRYAVVGNDLHQIVHLHNWHYQGSPQRSAPVYGYRTNNGQSYVAWEHAPLPPLPTPPAPPPPPQVVRTYTIEHQDGTINHNLSYRVLVYNNGAVSVTISNWGVGFQDGPNPNITGYAFETNRQIAFTRAILAARTWAEIEALIRDLPSGEGAVVTVQ
jgi:hypothetical protein